MADIHDIPPLREIDPLPKKLFLDMGKIRNDSHELTTYFNWKVAFNFGKTSTRTGFQSKKFNVVPLAGLTFWLVITKDNSATVSVHVFKSEKDTRGDSKEIKVRMSINNYNYFLEERIMKEQTNHVSVTVKKHDVSDISFESRQWWYVRCTLLFTGFQELETLWCNSRYLNGEVCREDRELPLWKGLGDLLKSGAFSDVTLKTAESDYKLHKCILVSRSKLFETSNKSFEDRMAKLRCIPKVAIDAMLDYMYTAVVSMPNGTNAISFYNAANEFALEALCDTYSRYLVKDFQVDSILELIKMAHIHKDETLQMEAVKFAAKHFNQISITRKWRTFERKYDTKLVSIIKAAATYFDSIPNNDKPNIQK